MRKIGIVTCTILLALALATLPACSSGQGSEASSSQTASVVEGAQSTTNGAVVPVTTEHVRLIGRTCVEDSVTWLPQSGSAVEFRVTGKRVELELAGDDNVNKKKDLRPRFAVLVDGEVVLDDTMDESTRVVEAFSGETERTAVVEVIHLSEALNGAVGVKTISVDSRETDCVVPTAEKDMSIEFIGDSITCAYGVESSSADDSFTTTTENFMKSYAYLAAQELGADYSAVCYSGYGVVSGWSDDGSRNTERLVPPLYGVVAKGYEEPWDYAAHPYDVVVVNLGTNDFVYTGTNKDRMEEFAQGYADFLVKIHESHPDAYLICTLGTMEVLELYPYVEKAAAEYTARTKDDRITCYPSEPMNVEADGAGANEHPTAKTQQKSADALVKVIRSVVR